MGVESLKFFITVYMVFVGILIFLSLGNVIDFNLPTPPEISGSAIMGVEMVEAIKIAKSSNIVGFVIGTVIELNLILRGVLAFFINFVFYLASLLLFTIEGYFFINLILTIMRILVLIDLIPYIKNMVHPTTQASH